MSIVKKDEPLPLITEAPRYSNLDTSHINDQSYSIRIPDFIKKDWDKVTQTTEIGEITVEDYGPGIKPKMFVTLNSNVRYEVPFEEFPTKFEIKMDPETSQQNYLFTAAPDSGYVKIAGKVIGNGYLTSEDAERMTKCSEYVSSRSKNEKKDKIKKGKKVIEFNKEEELYTKPVLAKRKTKDRTLRLSPESIKEELFMLFNQYPEWTSQDLAKQINQNPKNVTEVLRTIAVYNEKTKTYTLNKNFNI